MRIYDTKNKHWATDDFYISLKHNELYVLKKGIFGKEQLAPVPKDRYVVHNNINLYDKNNKLIFEGDYVKAHVSEHKVVIGLVAFIYEISSYVILSENTDEFFALSTDVCKHIQIIGNVFDGYEE